MIHKNKLLSFISKYYLNGLSNQVKWRIKDGKLLVYAGEAGRVCRVELDNFPLEDGELGIFDTHKLSKLISITSGELMLSVDKVKSIFTKLYLQDANYTLIYSLADVLILGKNTYYNDPEKWVIELNLTQDDVDHLIKAKNALSDVSNMLITTTTDLDGTPICEFIFGDNTGFSHKITYPISTGTISISDLNLPFNSDVFKEILSSNKDQDACTLKISQDGILKLNFDSTDLKSEYFMARNE
jgi:hypothetical protein